MIMETSDISKIIPQNYAILVVDDNVTNLKVVVNYLKEFGFKMLTASSGESALKRIEAHPPDLILLDVMMPGMDGWEVCRRLKADSATTDIPIIFMTALASEDDKVKGFDAGAVDYVTKPIQQREVLARVATHLRLQDQARQLAAMNAAKDKFFSIVAHDLRTPFNPLIGMGRYFADVADNTPYEEIRARGKTIYQAAASVHDLLENLLQWSRLERGQMNYTPVYLDLSNIVAANVQLLSSVAANKGIAVISALPPVLPIYADRNMVDTITRNLISNALKFTPRGGQVTVMAQPATGAPEWVEITVRDTGVGISAADQTKLFKLEVHHSTPGTAAETGTGLGLILCQEMVQQHGGRIWIESQEGAGAAVKFTIRLAEGQVVDWAAMSASGDNDMMETAAPTAPPPLPPADLQAIHALIKLGNMRKVTEWSEELAARDEACRPFAEQVIELARGFQKKQLLALVERYLNLEQTAPATGDEA